MAVQENGFKICPSTKDGQWYPAEAAKYSKELDGYLAKVQNIPAKKPRIIIVPHPGLDFGGATAAYAYKAAAQYKYRNIFVIATSHYAYFTQIVVGDFSQYQTPLDNIAGNMDIFTYLQHQSETFVANQMYIAQEHGLEMQYGFIKKCFPEAKIIPILLADTGTDNAYYLAEHLYSCITEEDLVIISTDLSHYPTYEIANKIDRETLDIILRGKPMEFIAYLDNAKRPANTSTFVCGAIGVSAALLLAQKLGISDIELLHYENSGDTAVGDKKAVVGYGAVAFYPDENEHLFETVNLHKAEKEYLFKVVHETLEHALKNIQLTKRQDFEPKSKLAEHLGAFVTLKIDGKLRGCMGNFEPDTPLAQVVQYTTLLAAFQDKRFAPLTLAELPQIEIDISILSPRKKVNSYLDIIPGKHGVYLQKGNKGGTYLPQVAPDQGWDRVEMLNSLCADKIGLEQDAWQADGAQLSTYTALVLQEQG